MKIKVTGIKYGEFVYNSFFFQNENQLISINKKTCIKNINDQQ